MVDLTESIFCTYLRFSEGIAFSLLFVSFLLFIFF